MLKVEILLTAVQMDERSHLEKLVTVNDLEGHPRLYSYYGRRLG